MLNALVAYAAEEGAAPNPLIPAWYDIIWSAVCFVVILFVFWRVALPKMKALLDARSAAIEGNIAKADEAQRRAEAALEEYTSQYDGRTYYRQVLVEETGFEFDILMQVYDGKTGELLYSDNFKDFKTLEGAGADPVQGMFQNLFALEDRIVGIFAKKDVEATRVLYTP